MFGFGDRRVRIRWAAVAAALFSLVILSHRWTSRAASTEGQSVPPVSPPAAPAAATSLRLSGSLAALHSVTLTAPRILGSRSGFNRGGDAGFGGGNDFNLVLLTLAKAGTHVKAGDVVAQFDPQNQLLRLDDYKDTVARMQNQLQSAEAALASTLEAQRQSVRSAKADWDKAQLDLQTSAVVDAIDVEKMKLSVQQADETYHQLEKTTALIQESNAAQIRILEFNLKQAQIEERRAEGNVEKMTVHSPIDGFIVMANIVRNGEYGQVREGDQVFAGQPFVTVVDPSSMVLNATLNQVDAERLRLGMKAVVRLDAYAGLEFPGELTGIGAMAVSSTFRAAFVAETPVRVQIVGRDPRLLPDLTGSAEVTLDAPASRTH